MKPTTPPATTPISAPLERVAESAESDEIVYDGALSSAIGS